MDLQKWLTGAWDCFTPNGCLHPKGAYGAQQRFLSINFYFLACWSGWHLMRIQGDPSVQQPTLPSGIPDHAAQWCPESRAFNRQDDWALGEVELMPATKPQQRLCKQGMLLLLEEFLWPGQGSLPYERRLK